MLNSGLSCAKSLGGVLGEVGEGVERIRLQKRESYLRNIEKIKERRVEYRIKNREAIKEQQRLYFIKNKESILEKQKLYKQNNQEAIKEQQSNWRNQNRLTIQETIKKYHLKNKHTIKLQKQLYYIKNKHTIKLKLSHYRLQHKKPRKHLIWTNPLHVTQFFESAKVQLHISNPDDWYRISRTQINQLGGGALYNSFGNLGRALQYAYPDIPWDLQKFSFRGKKASQRWLRVVLQQILPERTDVLEDYLHPDLYWDESRKQMELDIWVPNYHLALEYQGEQHYHDLHSAFGPNGMVSLYMDRDNKKKTTCAERGITLATIPYWWDGTSNSLSSTLHLLRSDVFPMTDAPAIPTNPPTKRKGPMKDHEGIVSFLMHGMEWDGEQDPTGWFISEKLDGFRAFWDGSKLYSRKGKVFSVPPEFSSQLPRDICLDGELWTGYDELTRLSSIFRKTNPDDWKIVKYCVFGTPLQVKLFQEAPILP
eukprot:TRINITY_DN3987_c0_g2_i2.p1 TRINITY_DN3987_c0_g2~~TRINITY_DN3987_c0_g2_i2.p1  ORF type:complete len:480 (-),score=120.91 TRINITY_DN3987_c0_g2_i2:412-1851(-)